MTTPTRRSPATRRVAVCLAAMLGVLVLAGSASATVSGRNGPIAFKRFLTDDHSQSAIFTIRADGTRERQLTRPAAGVTDDQPDWSPSGSQIAFQRCAPDTVCAVYAVRANGRRLRRLSPPCTAAPPNIETKCADESGVAFAPDGRHVVLTRSTGLVREFEGGEGFIEHSDIVVRDLRGGNDRVVVRSQPFEGDNAEAMFSPTGTRLVFQRQNSPLGTPPGGIALFVVRSDGSHLRQITPWALAAGDHPDWSPDGKLILFHSQSDATQAQFYVVRPDGSGLRQITHVADGTTVLSASFSPDGKRITFAMTGVAGQSDVFTMRVDGSRIRPVTRTAAWDSAPDWGPSARRRHRH